MAIAETTSVVRRTPIVAYFVLVYAATVFGLIVLGPPSLEPGGQPNLLSLVVFPIMVIWVAVVGVVLTALTTGAQGLRELRARMVRWRVDLRWYAAALLIPPVSILLVLTSLSLFISPAFQPNLLLFGLAFGLVAGFFEEIGWTGYVYPRLRSTLGALLGAVVLGVLWGFWHLPVVDALGVASPHGPAWPWFFMAFVAMLTGLRVLIAWIYIHTDSVLLAQLMHASSTSFLVVLGAPAVSASQEALWYALYALVLWIIVGCISVRSGPTLMSVQPAG